MTFDTHIFTFPVYFIKLNPNREPLQTFVNPISSSKVMNMEMEDCVPLRDRAHFPLYAISEETPPQPVPIIVDAA